MNFTFMAINLRKVIRFILAVILPLAVVFLSQYFAGGTELYSAVIKPPLSPPPIVFPVVWTILYILMGIASFIIYEKGWVKDYVRNAISFYLLQLFVNFLWSIVFFRFEMFFAAFWVLLLLWVLVGITAAKFYRICHVAGILLIPYWLWCTFALYLNFGIWILNR